MGGPTMTAPVMVELSAGGRYATAGRRSGRPGDASRVRVACSGCGELLTGALHHDSKVSPGAVWGSSGAVATVPNAWPLPAGPPAMGGTCPGATPACSGCYAAALESAYGGLRRMVADNGDAIRHALQCGGIGTAAALLTAAVRRSVDLQRADGVARPVFRWHSDGDIAGPQYARAMRRAILATPTVEHWAYTRTLGAVRIFHDVPGFRLYVSADRFNIRAAARVAARWDRPLAILADNDTDSRELWDTVRDTVGDVIPAPVTCPAAGRWQHDGRGPAHIVGPDGRRATLQRGGLAVGACTACTICLPVGRVRSVVFLRHGTARDALGSLQRVRVSS
jgi:hypothetical protein